MIEPLHEVQKVYKVMRCHVSMQVLALLSHDLIQRSGRLLLSLDE